MNARQWIVFLVFTLMQISCGDGADPIPVNQDDRTPVDQDLAENPFKMHSQSFTAQAVISPGIASSTSARFKATHQLSTTR